ncbi:MAG TPA: VOC family protein [Candidatus Limnocylindrales bacterium]|jgi:catechol 2,3-dioxygenase-like lactoylglutathione lyase family enzyme
MQNASTMAEPKAIFRDAAIMPSFAVKDLDAARRFYGQTLGLDVRDGRQEGILEIHGKSSVPVLVYPKPDHQPAVFTVLNLQVEKIDDAVAALLAAGVTMERYNGENGITTDDKGIARGESQPGGGRGPSIAWFRDPSGNILSVLEGR